MKMLFASCMIVLFNNVYFSVNAAAVTTELEYEKFVIHDIVFTSYMSLSVEARYIFSFQMIMLP